MLLQCKGKSVTVFIQILLGKLQYLSFSKKTTSDGGVGEKASIEEG